MMTFALVLAILVAFAYGWFYAPKGTLTKITSTVWGGLLLAYETMSEQFHLLQAIIPPDLAGWFIGLFLVLTVAAAVRPGRR